MTGRARPDLRQARTEALRPLFATIEQQGRQRVWVARQLGIHRWTLYGYEHGEMRVPREIVERICQLIGVPVDVLITAPPDLIYQTPKPPKAASKPRKRAAGAAPRRSARTAPATAPSALSTPEARVARSP